MARKKNRQRRRTDKVIPARRRRLAQRDELAKASMARAALHELQARQPDTEFTFVERPAGWGKASAALTELVRPLLDTVSAPGLAIVRFIMELGSEVWNQMELYEGNVTKAEEATLERLVKSMRVQFVREAIAHLAQRKAALFASDHRVFASVNVERLPSGEFYTFVTVVSPPTVHDPE